MADDSREAETADEVPLTSPSPNSKLLGTPKPASEIAYKRGYAMLFGEPCRVVDCSISVTEGPTAAALHEAFKKFDKNGDGFLSPDEIAGVFQRPGGGKPLTEAEATEYIAKHDTNGDGKLSLEELATAIADEHVPQKRCHFTGVQIFSKLKIEEVVLATSTVMVPHVEKLEYKCLDVDEDGYLTTLDSDGNKSSDLRLPEFAPDAKKVSERIEAYLAAEKDFNVIVLSACGKRQVVDTRFIGEGLVK